MSNSIHFAIGYIRRLFADLRKPLFVGMVLICTGFAEEYWGFTDAQGRKIEAQIVGYNAESKTIVLKRKNGGSGTVPLNMLSEADHEYIDRWVANQDFLDEKRFKIQIEEDATSWEDAGDDDGVRKTKTTSYVIHLTNNTGVKLEGIRAEYCLYRDRKKYIETDNYKVPIGNFEVNEAKQIEPRSRHASFKRSSKFLNEVVGARFRFYMELNDGTEIMREVCVPGKLSSEKYPWKEIKVEQEWPEPTSYPDKKMSEQDVEAIAKTYIRSFKEEDFDAWKQLLAPMNPAAPELTESRFSYPAHNLKRLKIEEIDGLNVRISMRNTNNRELDRWLQLHSSGHIKYGVVIRHPVEGAIQSLYLLLTDDYSWRNTGFHALQRAEVPLCGYEINASRGDQTTAAKKILDWLIENGADHDPSDPKIAMPPALFKKCIRDARRSIANSGHHH